MNSNVKKFLALLAAGTALLAPASPSYAQFVVNDPMHMGAHIAQFAKQLKEWAETVQNYKVIVDAKEIAGVTRDISGKIRDISGDIKDLQSRGLALQQQIQEDLKKVASVKDLRLSNPAQLYAYGMALSGIGRSSAYYPSLSSAKRLKEALESAQQKDVATVFEVFDKQDVTSTKRMTYDEYRKSGTEQVASNIALEESVNKKKIETAFQYYKIADEMTAQSVELQATLKNPNRYSMTEAERIASMNTANNNMVEAMKLRQEADRLIAESANMSQAKQIASAAYADNMMAQSLIRLDEQRTRN